MKRVCIAVGFLLVAVGLCVFEQLTVESVYRECCSYIEAAHSAVKHGDFKSAGDLCKKLDDYWKGKYHQLSAMIEHGPLDDTATTISSLTSLAKSESDELERELIIAENQIKSIRNNQKITFGNIF